MPIFRPAQTKSTHVLTNGKLLQSTLFKALRAGAAPTVRCVVYTGAEVPAAEIEAFVAGTKGSVQVLSYQQVLEMGRSAAPAAPRAVPQPTDVAVIMYVCG